MLLPLNLIAHRLATENTVVLGGNNFESDITSTELLSGSQFDNLRNCFFNIRIYVALQCQVRGYSTSARVYLT